MSNTSSALAADACAPHNSPRLRSCLGRGTLERARLAWHKPTCLRQSVPPPLPLTSIIAKVDFASIHLRMDQRDVAMSPTVLGWSTPCGFAT